MNYSQTLDYLFTSLPSFQQVGADAYKPGLERVAEFCRHLGNPQRNYYTIHVAGTNGKGSVSHLVASILQQAGYRVGLFTSPHLKDFRERMRVNGEMISKQKVVNFVDRHHQKMEELSLSFFEMTTAMAFDFFAYSDVEVAVIETGLGGRLDATNIITPLVSIITNVGLDHTDLLGEELPHIAAEKAGIIKKSVPVVVGEASDEYNAVIEGRAAELKSKVIYAEREFEVLSHVAEGDGQRVMIKRQRDGYCYDLKLDLGGSYQYKNLRTVSAAVDYLHEQSPLTISRRAFIEGVASAAASTSLAGRWQTISRSPLVICDTGHNAHGIKLVVEDMYRMIQGEGRLICVVGFSADKDVNAILSVLPKEAYYIFTQANSRRAASAEEVAQRAAIVGLNSEVVADVKEALSKARAMATAEDVIFIGGSNYVVAEIL